MTEGLYNKYTVINNDTKEEVLDAFVLRPHKDKNAIKALYYYAELLGENNMLSSDLKKWLEGYTQYRCKRNVYCPIAKSTICCAHCDYKDLCLEQNDKMCFFVRYGDVIDSEECPTEET